MGQGLGTCVAKTGLDLTVLISHCLWLKFSTTDLGTESSCFVSV